jgi:hypothetical protein
MRRTTTRTPGPNLLGDADLPPPPPTPGTRAVLAWSRVIHGRSGDRHDWAAAAAALLDARGPGADLPPFPSPHAGVRAERAATARRLWREAGGTGRVYNNP